MLKRIEKYYPLLSITLIVVLLVSIIFWPGTARLLPWIILFIGLTLAIAVIIEKHMQANKKKGLIDLPTMIRRIVMDVLIILVTMVIAVLITGKVATYIGDLAGRVSESKWSGTGTTVRILFYLLTAVVVGLWVGNLASRVRRLFTSH